MHDFECASSASGPNAESRKPKAAQLLTTLKHQPTQRCYLHRWDDKAPAYFLDITTSAGSVCWQFTVRNDHWQGVMVALTALWRMLYSFTYEY